MTGRLSAGKPTVAQRQAFVCDRDGCHPHSLHGKRPCRGAAQPLRLLLHACPPAPLQPFHPPANEIDTRHQRRASLLLVFPLASTSLLPNRTRPTKHLAQHSAPSHPFHQYPGTADGGCAAQAAGTLVEHATAARPPLFPTPTRADPTPSRRPHRVPPSGGHRAPPHQGVKAPDPTAPTRWWGSAHPRPSRGCRRPTALSALTLQAKGHKAKRTGHSHSPLSHLAAWPPPPRPAVLLYSTVFCTVVCMYSVLQYSMAILSHENQTR